MVISDSRDKYVDQKQICQESYYDSANNHYFSSYTQQDWNAWVSAEEHHFQQRLNNSILFHHPHNPMSFLIKRRTNAVTQNTQNSIADIVTIMLRQQHFTISLFLNIKGNNHLLISRIRINTIFIINNPIQIATHEYP